MTITGQQTDHKQAMRLSWGGITIELYPSDQSALVFAHPNYSIQFRVGRIGGDTGTLNHCVVLSPYLDTLPAAEPPTAAQMTGVVEAPHNRPTEMGLSEDDDEPLEDTDLSVDEWQRRSVERRETSNIRLEMGREKLERLIEESQGDLTESRSHHKDAPGSPLPP